MYSYLLQNNLFAAAQSAYRTETESAYRTETALLRIMNDILQAIDKHEDTILGLF